MIRQKFNLHRILSKQAEQSILGSMLGDGCLSLPKLAKNPYFQMRHSPLQKEYFLWKAELLLEIQRPVSSHQQMPDGYSKDAKLHFSSKNTERLMGLYELIYKTGKKSIRRRWLNLMTPLSLLIWWLDDGSIISSRKGVFCTDGFSLEEIEILKRYLLVVWNITTHIGQVSSRKSQYRLYFHGVEELKKFLRIILPELKIKSMLYKFFLKYKDHDLQQRWISEIASLSGFSDLEIRESVEQRRSENDIVHSS